MAYESSITTLSEGDKVRFTAERLSMLAPADRKRLEGRVGVVQGRWNHTRKRTVYFPEDGGRSELRILSVEPNQLERVVMDAAQPDVPPADDKLSQEDMDNLFG
jgi:hypothetical protein